MEALGGLIQCLFWRVLDKRMAQPGNADANGQVLGHLPASPVPAEADAIGNVPAFDFALNRIVSGPGSKFAAAPASAAPAEEPAGQAGGRRRRAGRKSRKGKGNKGKSRKTRKGKGKKGKSRKTRKGKGKSRKSRRGRKTGRRTRSHRGGGIIGTYLADSTANLQGVVNDLNRLLGDDQARRAITAEQSKLMAAKRQVAAATQTTYKVLSNAAAKLAGKPGTGRAVALLQQAANTQPDSRVFIRP